MKIRIKQKSKELFVAEFEIIENENVIGNVFVKGALNSVIPNLSINFKDKNIIMEHHFRGLSGQPRFYKIMCDNSEYGSIYEKKYKTGFLSYKYVPTLESNGKEYQMDSIGVGKYELDGLVKTDNGYDLTIYNEIYNYNIECDDDLEEALRTIILTMYRYSTIYFKSGEKTTKSVRKVHFKAKGY